MKNLLSKTNYIILLVILLLMAIFACARNDGLTPEEVVRKYFEYCSKREFNAAVNLTCFQRNCIYDGETSDTGEKTIASSIIDQNGKVTDGDDSPADWIKGGWYSPEVIADKQARMTKTISTKTSKNVIEMIIETNNWYNVKRNYVNCLRREKGTNNWKLEQVGSLNHAEIAENDPCSLQRDGK